VVAAPQTVANAKHPIGLRSPIRIPGKAVGASLLQELRVTQTGTQIISGFLLSVAFQPTFRTLPAHARTICFVLVILACATTLLGLVPVVQHRKSRSPTPGPDFSPSARGY
jgi:hypothetical protein